MEQDSYYFRVGLFVAIGLFAAISVIGVFASKRDNEGHTAYAVYFSGAVDGVGPGSAVKLKGIQVGFVESVGFAGERSESIRVIVQVRDGTPIHATTTAFLQLQGITGGSLIALDNTDPGSEPLSKRDKDEYLVIASRPSSLERVFTSVPQLIEEITKLAVQGQKMLNDDNVKAVHDSLASVSAAIGSLDKLIGSKNGPALQGTLEQLNEMIGEAKITLREVKMLARTLREDPSIVIHGVQHKGVEVP